jgi:hypothetical protein
MRSTAAAGAVPPLVTLAGLTVSLHAVILQQVSAHLSIIDAHVDVAAAGAIAPLVQLLGPGPTRTCNNNRWRHSAQWPARNADVVRSLLVHLDLPTSS